MKGTDFVLYIKMVWCAMYPWGFFVGLGNLLTCVLFERNAPDWNIWLAINKAVVFCILFSVVIGYVFWLRERHK